MKNWKTTVAGIAVGLIAAATAMGYLTGEQGVAITGLLTTLGFVASKDHNVSGGSVKQD